MNLIARAQQLIEQSHRRSHFLATVATYAAGPPPTATITRGGQTAADASSYPVADHVGALSADDRVFVVDTTGAGGFVVMAKIG